MERKVWKTPCGPIYYWVGGPAGDEKPALVFLPGLTADHRLFEQQTAYFVRQYPVLVWDAPGHGVSWPFTLSFDLMDQAQWLEEILCAEGLDKPVIVGQSMGGYVGQAYAERYPEKLRGFVAVDSAPLQRSYVTGAELWMLKRMEPVYRHWPWKWLLSSGSKGVAVTEYGRKLMRDMMMCYDGDQERYAQLAGCGFRMLAEAMEKDLPYALQCPSLLICGEKDRAGSCRRYNKAWHRRTGIPIRWIPDAGHNSNSDAPQLVNQILEQFFQSIGAGETGTLRR